MCIITFLPGLVCWAGVARDKSFLFFFLIQLFNKGKITKDFLTRAVRVQVLSRIANGRLIEGEFNDSPDSAQVYGQNIYT